MAMTSKEIRQSFLDFFKSKQHTIVPSGSLLPDAPNLLFTNAGMNQFIPIFLGQANCPYSPGRAANTQKCIRAGGKHNDLEDVGLDTYHHTFFEMLGNWSFGDYFKEEAIDWAWELLTEVWGFPKDRLFATYFGGDEISGADIESRDLWLRFLPEERVIAGSRKDNFWMMGDTGPCGPCSEIHVDLTPDGHATSEMVNADLPEVIEIWNLVFIQFNANPDGTYSSLPAKHVDTGMGFERACSIIQCTKGFTDFSGVISNYETDVFTPIFHLLESISGKKYTSTLPADPANQTPQEAVDVAFRVIADHIRCLSFAVADGILPSNEGRGYVLRRILRRAVRYGRSLGLTEPFFYMLAGTVADSFGDVFPELNKNRERIEKTIKTEEDAFNRTLDRGIERFEQVAERVNDKIFPAEEAFRLYDTFGFPLDLTELMARERGFEVDVAGFEKLMNEQRERARADHAAKKAAVFVENAGADVKPTEFIGYGHLQAEAVVEAVSCTDDGIFSIVLDKTPCYPEMGGQVGDTGRMRVIAGGEIVGELEIVDTQKQGELFVHVTKLIDGRKPESGEKVQVEVDAGRRADIQRHHTATHLFHWALHEVVSKDARQRGSLVAEDHLRFDFNAPEKLSARQIEAIEKLVNEKIKAAEPVYTVEVSFSEVKQHPEIQQFFGEKYGDVVRVVQCGGEAGKFNGFSMELCGGCHVKSTSELQLFKIMSESSIAAGIRRVEAACGVYAERFIEEQKKKQAEAEAQAAAAEEKKRRAKQRRAELQARAPAIAEELLGKVKDGLLVENLGEADAALLAAVMDQLQPRLESTIAILGGVSDGKVALICAVTPDLIAKGKHAGKIIGAVAKRCGGGGGGRPNRAQAGGKNPDALDAALAWARDQGKEKSQ